MTFTLIAYKPSGERSCRGHVVESYDSDFVLEESLSRDDLIRRVAELTAYDHGPEWQIHYFTGAELATEDEIERAAREAAEKIVKARAEGVVRAVAQAEMAERRRKVAADLREYERLKKQFEGGA